MAAYHDKKFWRQLQKNGMARDFSWDASAQRYIELYESLAPGLSRLALRPVHDRVLRVK